nr:unknown [Darna trima granulovirus]
MQRFYFLDTYPVTLYNFGGNEYYFKVKQLTTCLNLCANRICRDVRRHYVTTFADLKNMYPKYKHTANPNTLMLHIKGLNGFMREFCSKVQHCLMLDFVRNCLQTNYKWVNNNYHVTSIDNNASDEMENSEEYDCVQCVYGTTPDPHRVEFIILNEKIYFKASDVARNVLKCSPSYCINKFVDDVYMVTWGGLKKYILNRFVWSNYSNRWKENTLFLKDKGVQQLVMAMNGGNDEAYRKLLSCIHYEDCDDIGNRTKIYSSCYRKKHLKAQNCVVGFTENGLHYIVTPDLTVYFKLRQIMKIYNFKLKNYDYYDDFIVRWKHLKKHLHDCNVMWKDNLIMVNEKGVIKMLSDLNLKADEFIICKVNELKKIWNDNFNFNGKV